MIWYVAVGSALGGMSRYAISLWMQRVGGASFPLGTLLINITGSFLLGFLLRAASPATGFSPELRLALTTGFCGGYTTFSTFSYETITLIETGEWRRAAAYVALSVVVSLLAAFAGVLVARQFLAVRPS